MHWPAALSRRRRGRGSAAGAGAPWHLARPATRRVGFISGGTAEDAAGFMTALRADLARRGHVEPETLAFDLRFADGDLARIPGLVAELERGQAAVIGT